MGRRSLTEKQHTFLEYIRKFVEGKRVLANLSGYRQRTWVPIPKLCYAEYARSIEEAIRSESQVRI